MTMNSTMLIKSYGVVLRCQVIDIIVMFSDPDPVFFNSSNETDSLSKVWNLSLINMINPLNIKSGPLNQDLKNSGWNPSCGRILCFSTKCLNENILSLWYQNQAIQKPKFISTYRNKTSMKDLEWDKIILKNRIATKLGWKPSRDRILFFHIRYSNGNILSLWYRNQEIQKPKFIYASRTTTLMQDLKWDKIVLENRIWQQSGSSKRVSWSNSETDNAEHPDMTENMT